MINSGVLKSGSPSPSSIISLPSAFNCLAFCAKITVHDGEIFNIFLLNCILNPIIKTPL